MSGRLFFGFLDGNIKKDERSKIDRSSQESKPTPKVKYVHKKWCGTCKLAQPLVNFCPDRNLISKPGIDWAETPGQDCTRYDPIE